MTEITATQAMLVNVGGAVAPAIHTLNEQRPRFICFFVSEDSRPLIREKILPALQYQPEHYDWIETPVPQSLLECYRSLANDLARILEKWKVPPEALAVEFTAGTKPMSVAAVMATINATSRYSYVGARDLSGRDRDGIGVVLDGKELTWFQTNPWEELAVRERRDIALLFNHGRFADARERALRLVNVVPAEMRKVYEALAELIEGYALWDRFEYRQARDKINKATSNLRLYVAGRDEPLRATLDAVIAQVDFLNRLTGKTIEEVQRLDLLDMLANADRRAKVAQRYDDAVARLYSALEGLARNRLSTQFNIKANAVKAEQVPETQREQYVKDYLDQRDGYLKLGLYASYELLNALGDELGKRYTARAADLERVLLARNQSRLAHGTEPVKQETYDKLRDILKKFADVQETDLPRFPELKL